MKFPTIDFCNNKPNLKPGTSEWESTKAQVFKALQEHGFFEAIYDNVPYETGEALCDTLEQVLPLRTKLKEYWEKPIPRYEGRVPRLHYNDYENATHVADLLLPEAVETFSNTFWSDGNPHFCNVVKSYYKPLVELDEMVKVMVLERLGLEKYVDDIKEMTHYNLRFTQYYKSTDEEGEGDQDEICSGGKERRAGHTDGTWLSIIKQKQVGLQVRTRKGEWIELPVSPNSYFVLAQDALVVWTNGRLPEPATHRVVMKGDMMTRCSIQLFSTPKPGYTIKAPKELVDEGHPLLFEPFDLTQFHERLTSGAYAGIRLVDYVRD